MRAATSQNRAYATTPGSSASKSSSASVKAFTALTTVAAIAAFWSQSPVARQIECEAPPSNKEEKKPSKTVEADQKRKLEGLTEDSPMRLRMEAFNKRLQAEITARIEKLDGQGKFRVDQWNRAEGGDGISMVMQDGKVFEKAGVGVSVVYGMLPPAAVAQMRAQHPNIGASKEAMPFFATGISCVMHPHNPNAPTVHFNYRYFEVGAQDGGEPVSWWFGGGCDLTPSILYEEDAVHFHRVIKEACDQHDPRYYKDFKKWCDDYFYIPHRGERRGVGGIFFDDLDDKKPNDLFAFVQTCGNAFLKQYVPIIEMRKDMPFSLEDKQWQQLRRARWEYMHEPNAKAYNRLMEVLKTPKDWIPL
ncbi:Coproporphyrinogen-III oxidase [Mortierella sp. GBA43]|nr:Coproporphyrinogen-III oxidase [Mortierella sp. GBA43]